MAGTCKHPTCFLAQYLWTPSRIIDHCLPLSSLAYSHGWDCFHLSITISISIFNHVSLVQCFTVGCKNLHTLTGSLGTLQSDVLGLRSVFTMYLWGFQTSCGRGKQELQIKFPF